METKKVSLSAKVRFLEDHETGLSDGNRRLQKHLVCLSVYKERWKPRKSGDKRATNDTKVELANLKEIMSAPEYWAQSDWVVMPSAIEDLSRTKH